MTTTSNIASNLYLTSAPKAAKQTGDSNLGKDAFLQLMIAQLQHQDPTAPMDNSEFIAQMAQFTTLEQMQNMTSSIEDLVEMQSQSQLIEYSGFLGRTVSWTAVTENKDADGNFLTESGENMITSLKYVDGTPVFKLDNDKEITPSNIAGLSLSNGVGATESNSLVQASTLIGKTVSYLVDEIAKTSQVTSVSNKDGKLLYTLADGTQIEGSKMTSVSQ